ncbi:DUF4843 domain-containing protein [Butyricimonas faecihominis]|uniref:DUF4843 domain-containing protein n=1 Tax=Butyricimonas faecihominis TaxID=1472416 RepID=UPI00266FD9A7|nr:DUF4843 domain-containing protein [Butyricimonas faecihominis]
MKRRYIAILIIGLATWLCACETEMMGYEGESGIYFMMQKPPASGYGDPEQYEYVDTTLISFAMFTAKDTVLPIRVRITGDVVDHDRYFTIRVVDTLTTAKAGEDYEPFENSQVVKAGERQAEVPCRIVWTEKLMQNPDTVIYLTVRLEESADFKLPLKRWIPFGSIYGSTDKVVNPLVHVIGINDQVVVPKQWTANYWGAFSPTKFKLVCVVLGLTMQDFEDYKTMNQNRSKALAQNFDRYLKEEKAAGRTVMDKDAAGNEFEMTMGPLV